MVATTYLAITDDALPKRLHVGYRLTIPPVEGFDAAFFCSLLLGEALKEHDFFSLQRK